MKTKMMLKKIAVLVGMLMVLVSINGIGYAIVMEDSKDETKLPIIEERGGLVRPDEIKKQEPKYAPGEVLAKFKEGVDPSSILKEAGIEAQGIERVHSIEPAVAKFRKDYKLEKDAKGGWYSFLGKNYKEVSDIPDEEMFKETYSKMPEVEKALYRSYKVTLPEGMSVEEAVNKLKQDPNVEYVEPNYIVKIQMIPNDPYYSTTGSWGQPYDDLWGIKKIQCEQAWDITQGEGVVVAVIDTGVDYNHEDLAENIWVNEDEIPGNGIDDDNNGYVDDVRGWDFVTFEDGVEDNDPMDGHGHGTHVSGTIAGIGNNNLGVIGVAPMAKIMAVKGLSDGGRGYASDLANCVMYAADNGAQVLSNSWGGRGTSQVLTDAFHYADSKGCVAIAAAGNDNMNVSNFIPANIDTVIAVAATNQNDQRCSFSNYGEKIDVSAPGGDSTSGDGDNYWGRNILSLRSDNNGQPTDMYEDGRCIVGSNYYRARGTSMACPHASGVAALLKSKYPTDSQEDILGRMIAGVDGIDRLNPGFEGLLGNGRINAFRSLSISAPHPVLKIIHKDARRFFPGDDSTIILAIKNFWLDAFNVIGELSTDNPNVAIHRNTASFGNILSGETKTNSENPFVVYLNPDIQFGERINFMLRISCNDSYEAIIDFVLFPTLFRDVTRSVNLPLNTCPPMSISISDYNNDSYSDVFFIREVPNPYGSLHKNLQNNAFVNVTMEAGISGIPLHYVVSLFLDINNDGNEDLFIGTSLGMTIRRGNYIFLNNGTGTYIDITTSSGLPNSVEKPIHAISLDYDNDGFLDILIYGYSPTAGESVGYIYRNNGNGTFSSVAWESIGIIYPPTYIPDTLEQMVSLDYDNDGDQDLLFKPSSNGSVVLYRNNGNGTFSNVTSSSLLSDKHGDRVTVGDYDNDGYIDIFINNGPESLLLKNSGWARFIDVTDVAGQVGRDALGNMYPGTEFFDYDNDSNLDLLVEDRQVVDGVVKSSKLYKNNGDGTFTRVNDMALPAPYEFPAGFGVACLFDYNNDGAIDIYAPVWSSNLIGGMFLENIIGTKNNWIKIKLIGTVNNRDAIGAKVYIRTENLQQLREVHNSSLETQPLHFGLGDNTIIDEIEIHWPRPNAFAQKLYNVGVNQMITIIEENIAPSNLTAQALSSTQIRLTWQDNSNDETGFKIERRIYTTSRFKFPFVEIASVPTDTTTYTDTGLTDDETYEYRVRAYDSYGNSDYSNTAYVRTVNDAILAPSDLEAVPYSPTQIELTWLDNSPDETGFKIEKSDDGGNFAQIAQVGADATSYTVGDLTQGSYYFRVRAYNNLGNSHYSNIAICNFMPPIAPSNLTTQALSSTKIKLIWQDNSMDEAGFEIEQSRDGYTFREIGTIGANVISYTVTDLTQGTYYFRVRAYNYVGISDYSNIAICSLVPPIAPSNLIATPLSSTKIQLTWQDNSSDETGFKVEMSTDGATFIYKGSTGADRTTFTITGLTADTTYYFRVYAYNTVGNAYSEVISAATLPLPIAPSNLTTQALSSTKIKLIWQDNSLDETGFKVEMSLDGATFSNKASLGANVTTYTVTGLTANTTYYFRVRAVRGSDYSDYSEVIQATTTLAPAAPTNLNALAFSPTQIDLAWQDSSDNEVGFGIERGTDGANFTEITTVGANITAYSDMTAEPDTGYYYRIYSYNNGGRSIYSNTVFVTTSSNNQPAPSNLKATASSPTRIRLTWVDNSLDEQGFKIERSDGGTNFTQIATVGADIKAYTARNLTTGNTYYFRVAAYKDNAVSEYSNTASCSLTSPIAPSNLTTQALSSTKLKLTWQDNSSDEKGFKVEISADGTTFTLKGGVGIDKTIYIAGNLTPDTVYYFRIYAYNAVGKSYSDVISATTLPLPVAPSNLTTQALSSTKIKLIWQDNSSDETGFKVEMSTDGTTFVAKGSAKADITTRTISKLTPNTTYYFRVYAYRGTDKSVYSEVVLGTTLPLPIAPSNLTATAISSTKLQLTWQDNSLDETGFKVEMSTDGTTYAAKGSAKADMTARTISKLTPNTTYYFRVYAYRGTDKSGYSEVVSGTTLPLPVAPSNLTATALSSTKLRLTWQDNSDDETGFKIEQSTDGITFAYKGYVTADKTTFTASGLTSGTTYYYRAYAYRGADKSTYSNVASGTTR